MKTDIILIHTLSMANDFKPNIYPIMYWALAFGATAGVLLWLVTILSNYISLVWFPVFLAGLLWGGYRNYRSQKLAFEKQTGQNLQAQSPMEEFKQAVSDVAAASGELLNQEAEEGAGQSQPEGETTQIETRDSDIEPRV